MPAKFKVGDYAIITPACPNSYSEATYHKASTHTYGKPFKVVSTGPSFNDNIYKGLTYELEGSEHWYYLPYHLEKADAPIMKALLKFAGYWNSKPSLKKQLVLL